MICRKIITLINIIGLEENQILMTRDLLAPIIVDVETWYLLLNEIFQRRLI